MYGGDRAFRQIDLFICSFCLLRWLWRSHACSYRRVADDVWLQLWSETIARRSFNAHTPLSTAAVGEATAPVCLDIGKTLIPMERYRTPTVFHVSYQRLSVFHWKYRTNLFRANHFPFGLHAIKIAHYVAKVLDCFFLIFTCKLCRFVINTHTLKYTCHCWRKVFQGIISRTV